MRRTSRLKVLQASTNKCFYRLREEAACIDPRGSLRAIEVSMCRVTIDTLNTWNNFCRAYFLSGMLQARRKEGFRIAVNRPGLPLNQVIEEAIIADTPLKTRRAGATWGRREEPKWYVYGTFDRICRTLNFSNYTSIQEAFSSGSRVFADLPVFRNYFAHRNDETQRKATNLAPRYGISATYRPSKILLTRPVNRPQPLILDWLDDLTFTVEYLCH